MQRLEKRFEALKTRGDINEELGVKSTSKQMQRLDIETENVYNSLARAKDKLNDFVAIHGLEGMHFTQAQEELKRLGQTEESVMDRFKKNLKTNHSMIGSFSKRIWGLVKRIFVFSLIAKAFRSMINGMKEGLQNFAQYSKEYNKIMSDFKSQTEQLKNSMATAFAPIVSKIIPWLTRLVSALNVAMNTVAQFFAVLSGKSTFSRAKAQAIDYAKSLKKVGAEANKLASFDDINVLEQDSGGGGGDALTGADAFEEVEVDRSKFEWVEWLKEKMQDILALVVAVGVGLLAWKISSLFLGALSTTAIAIGLLVGGIALVVYALYEWITTGEITNTQLLLLVSGIMLIAGAIAILTGSWIPLVVGAVIGLVALIIARWDEIKEFVIRWWEIITSYLADHWNRFVTDVRRMGQNFVQFWVNVGQSIWTGIVNVWNAIKTFFTNFWSAVVTLFTTKVNNLKTQISNFGTHIRTTLNNIKTFIHNIGSSIWNGIRSFINKIIGGIEGMVNRCINGINGLIDAINSISFELPDIMGGGRVGFNLRTLNTVSLPRLATGGITNRPTTALIGENGREAVLPLENNTEWMDVLADKIGGGNVTIKFDGSLSQLARVLNPVLDAETSRIGTTLVVE